MPRQAGALPREEFAFVSSPASPPDVGESHQASAQIRYAVFCETDFSWPDKFIAIRWPNPAIVINAGPDGTLNRESSSESGVHVDNGLPHNPRNLLYIGPSTREEIDWPFSREND